MKLILLLLFFSPSANNWLTGDSGIQMDLAQAVRRHSRIMVRIETSDLSLKSSNHTFFFVCFFLSYNESIFQASAWLEEIRGHPGKLSASKLDQKQTIKPEPEPLELIARIRLIGLQPGPSSRREQTCFDGKRNGHGAGPSWSTRVYGEINDGELKMDREQRCPLISCVQLSFRFTLRSQRTLCCSGHAKPFIY